MRSLITMTTPRAAAPVVSTFVLLAGWSVAVCSAQTAIEAQAAIDLVGQLADPSYSVRESAERRLLLLGENALPAVESATTSADPEQRSRASRLLVQLRRHCFEQRLDAFVRDVAGQRRSQLPGWIEFEQLVGPTVASRRVFAELFRADPELFKLVFEPTREGPPREPLREVFERRVVTLQSYATGRAGADAEQDDLAAASLATLCVAATQPDAVSKRSCQLLTQLARSELTPLARGEGSQPRVARGLLAQWIITSQTDDLYLLSPMLQLVDTLELREATPLVIAIATGERRVHPDSAKFRAAALLKVGKLANSDAISKLAPLLEDRSVCATQAGRSGEQGKKIDLEVRDVALAVMIHLSGEQPREFGFDSVAKHADRLFVLRSLAFRNEQQRADALASWQRRGLPAEGPLRVASGGDAKLR